MSAFSGLDKQAQENDLSVEELDSEEKESGHAPAPISVSLSLAAAIRAHKKGKMEKAVQIYSSILRKYPDHADANYLLGVAAFERGLKEDAIAMIERAIEAEPENASYYGKLGEILTVIGYVERADEAYEKAALLAPGDVRFHLGRAQIMERNGEIDAALKQYRMIVEQWDDAPEAYYRCATIEARKGERDLARKHVKQAILQKKDYAEAHFLYGLLVLAHGEVKIARNHFQAASSHSATRSELHVKVAQKLMQLGDFDGALQALHRETKINPYDGEAFLLMGDCLREKGEPDGAVLSYDRAIENAPSLAVGFAKKGLALLDLSRFEEAHEYGQKAVALAPNDPESLCALGVMLREMDKIDEAIDVLSKTVRIAPTSAQFMTELARAFQEHLELDQALHYTREAKAMAPSDKEIHFLESEVLLQKGHWAEGWSAYEARKSLKNYFTSAKGFEDKAPLWKGGEISGKRIMVFGDGCVSEMIQYARFLPRLKALGADVQLCVPRDLARLFAPLEGISGLVPLGTPLPRFDLQVALSSLAHYLNISEDDLKDFAPYLSADTKDVKIWQERVNKDAGGKSVGLVWQGDKAFSKNSRRSPGIWPFSRLFYMRNIDFFGLQTGDGSDVLGDPQLAKVVRNYGIELLDFADTAGVIAALDLVVTCDTAVAHLAGAMGKEVWVVLPYGCDWRWGIPNSVLPSKALWYPSMTLYRQSEPGDWADVFARLGQALDQFTPT